MGLTIMALHIYPVVIHSTTPPISGLLSRPSTEFRCTYTVIYLHGLNGSRNQIFQDRYLEFAEAIKALGSNLLAVDLPCHGDRRKDKNIPAAQNLLKVIGQEENNPFTVFLDDIPKIIDFAVEKKITRPGEIAVVGMAWGATNALYALCRERRIRCGVLLLPVCKITSMAEFRQIQNLPIIEQYEPLTFVQKIAPKPLLFITGEKDTRANPGYASQLYHQLEPEYAEAGVSDKLAYAMLAGVGHAYDSDMTELTVEWFKKHLLSGEEGLGLKD